MLYPGEVVLDDSVADDHSMLVGDGSCGFGFTGAEPDGYGALATPFPPELLIPKSEYQGRCEEMVAQGTLLSQRILAENLPCKNQSTTEFCFANAPATALEVLRILQNEPMVIFSPASVACKITGFQNHGGWAKTVVQWISTHGIVPVTNWPANAISRTYDTDENWQIAAAYKFTDWTALVPRNLDQVLAFVFRRLPVPVAYNRWAGGNQGHEVLACDPVWTNGTIGIRIRNSWGSQWGSNGFAVLAGNRAIPDDAICPYSALPS